MSEQEGETTTSNSDFLSRSESSIYMADLKQVTSNWITRSYHFKKLCRYVFDICDKNKTGAINSTELYAGVLLVHLTLAKYAGPAACYPASRETVEELFKASDDDDSGGIDKEEFETIVVSEKIGFLSVMQSWLWQMRILSNRLAHPKTYRLLLQLQYPHVSWPITRFSSVWFPTLRRESLISFNSLEWMTVS